MKSANHKSSKYGFVLELSDAYRHRQFRLIAQQLLMFGLLTYLVAPIAMYISWETANIVCLISWSVSLMLSGAWFLYIWYSHSRPSELRLVSKKLTIISLCFITLLSTLYAILFTHFFYTFSDPHRIVLMAVVAGFISTGAWQLSSLPLAGILWTLPLCIIFAVAISVMPAHRFDLISPLTLFYGAYLSVAVIASSRKQIEAFDAETEVIRQSETVGLLLNDFEEKASDWLWETNASGTLSHVSVRLTEAVGSSAQQLLNRSYVNIITALVDDSEADYKRNLAAFTNALNGHRPFNDLILPIKSEHSPLWWSFSAKPLKDAHDNFCGWRGVTSDITNNYESAREMQRLANVDSLTGLANRHHLTDQLNRFYTSPTTPCALFLIDLDNFKAVNDALGHAAGDDLLRAVSRRMTNILPEQAVLARLGGDEFALIIREPLKPEELAEFGQTLLNRISKPWNSGGHKLDVHASIGIAIAHQDAQCVENLLKAADLALYAAKACGRDALRFFTPQMEEQAQLKRSTLNDMRRGLNKGEFVLFYQPQINLIDGKLTGFEALVRWHHPQRGLLSPIDFIPLAEESGLIVPLGRWILQQACTEACSWPSDLRVAVNVSAIQIERSDIIFEVNNILQSTQIAPNRLEIELTESTLMGDSASTLILLNELRDIGVRIALDDFGTGFSSLAYLNTFPLDKLKIDRSFVTLLAKESEDTSSAIVDTIARLARTLDLETTAEGVETAEQFEVLSRLGIDYGQGYLYAKPMRAEEVLEFIKTLDLN
ncbi:putative bifunctional diguanylate cyclase/phosphodiesterase [Marinomonas dokdonensis]|uniref:putative bifunctional diguanylate cyclase/phosphodiesterase n=1 Tax=Marinomonas dokdonensis TaxID=328224 RepID=UPI00405549F4